MIQHDANIGNWYQLDGSYLLNGIIYLSQEKFENFIFVKKSWNNSPKKIVPSFYENTINKNMLTNL